MKKTVIAAMLCVASVAASAQAMQLKDLPDDARASVLKELLRARMLERQQRGATPDPRHDRHDSCEMEIASDKQPKRNGGQRNNTTVITGSVVQLCGR